MEFLINGAANFGSETHHTDALDRLRVLALQQREHFDRGAPAPLRFKRSGVCPVTGVCYEREETDVEVAFREREAMDRRMAVIAAAIAAQLHFIAEAKQLGMSVADLLARAQEAFDRRVRFSASICRD